MVYPARKHVTQAFKKLMPSLPDEDKTKTHVIFLAGEITPFRNDTDREMLFRQESNFYYLSGCSIPSSYLLVTLKPNSDTPSIDLFIPTVQPADLMWSVPPPSLEEASQAFSDITSVSYTSALRDALYVLMKSDPSSIIHVLPRYSPLYTKFPSEINLSECLDRATIEDSYLLPALHRARLIKTEEEIALIRRANVISSEAHEVVMRVLGSAVKGKITKEKEAGVNRPLLPGEWLIEKEAEAEAVFVATCRRQGAIHQAYLPIVAASTRAATLHYCCNDRDFAWGPVGTHDHHNKNEFAHGRDKELNPQVLLIDAGCEWNCYAADITRTMPVGNGGKFTPEARAIYELVLEMQKLSMDVLKPGLHWDAVQLLCHRTLVKGFQRLGIFKSPNSPNSGSWNSEEAILASGASAAFFPHGVGHSLGLDVHDVPSASKPIINPTVGILGTDVVCEAFYQYMRLRLPLEEGMVVTVEPGIYFHTHLLSAVRDSKHIDHEVLKRYENVGGVRIEDVVVITRDGYENLTTVRSDVAWIEGVCSGDI